MAEKQIAGGEQQRGGAQALQEQRQQRVGARNSIVGPELRVRPGALLARTIGYGHA
jgi:hypothetical protein